MTGQPAPSGASKVAAGILASRVIGIVREQILAYYFGIGPHADVFRMVLRAPNMIQNLLGEGTLSASFIPVYSRFLHAGDRPGARRLAGAVFGLLVAATAALTLLGILFARPLVAVLAMGFTLEQGGSVNRFELAVSAVRIVFPMTAFLVLASWALGILNSHRRFFLPYFAPVLWNAAIILALVAGALFLAPGSPPDLSALLFIACWGALAGGILQFAVQLPAALRELGGFPLVLSTQVAGLKEVLRSLGPVLAGRGVVQVSGYLDYFLASFLALGAVSVLGYAQVLYILPISLFGMSVAASELPELSRLHTTGLPELTARVERSLRQMVFLSLPTVVGYFLFGRLLVGALFGLGRGRFGDAGAWLVYLVLCSYTLGLLASSSSRLVQNTFYALGEPRLPAKVATARVLVSTGLAVPLMLWLDRQTLGSLLGGAAPGETVHLGAVGLGLATSAGAWLEILVLRRALRKRLPSVLSGGVLLRPAALAGLAALGALPVWALLGGAGKLLTAGAVLGVYAALYLGLASRFAPVELAAWLGKLPGRRKAKGG